MSTHPNRAKTPRTPDEFGVEIRIEADELWSRILPGAWVIRKIGTDTKAAQITDGTRWVRVAAVCDDFWHVWGWNNRATRWERHHGGTVLWVVRASKIPTAYPDGEGWGRMADAQWLATQAIRTCMLDRDGRGDESYRSKLQRIL